MSVGVKSIGVRCPIIKEGDNLIKIVTESVISSVEDLQDNDVIGITESIVARADGNYATVDEIASEIKQILGECDEVSLLYPIYSRNRFSMILKAFARVAKVVNIVMPANDEVGNPRGINPFTGVNIEEYYKEICEKENAECTIWDSYTDLEDNGNNGVVFYCGLHDYSKYKSLYFTLVDICHDKCEYGLLGSNKSNEEKLKLFPNTVKSKALVHKIQDEIFEQTGKHVEVMIYGDGCFKDPVGGIWEFADPVVSPAYTSGLEGTPNEIKIKAFADDQFKDLSGQALIEAVKTEIVNKDKNLVGNMASQGTTPRRYTDLLGSLMDLTSGSGDKGTPVVVVQNYFKNYAV